MITIDNQTKRILKGLFNMRGEVTLSEGAAGIYIKYHYKNILLIICKSLDNRFYDVEQVFDDEESLVRFTTVSSVINYLKNNFQ